MAFIKVLDPLIASKIAAGEVVERPASVVKELIENSIDAGSRSISITIKDGGRSLIKVTDDGTGMSRQDAGVAFLRHATSKISTEDDLWAIRTMGFRGEALSSISSVSKVRLSTRQDADISGTLVVIEGSVRPEVSDHGCAKGTSIEVADLFFNTPARLKFLRSADSELGKITDIVRRSALCHPSIRFRLVHGSTRIIDSPSGDLLGRISDLFGSDVARDMIEVRSPYVSGYIGSHALTYATSKNLFISVNARPVADRSINRAIIDGYGQVIDHGRYPFAVLDLLIPCEDVDINIHPAKSEVRFRNQRSIYELFRSSVSSALSSCAPKGSHPEGTYAEENTRSITHAEANEASATYESTARDAYGVSDIRPLRPAMHQGLFSRIEDTPDETRKKGNDAGSRVINQDFLSLEPIGQLWGEFIIAQSSTQDGKDPLLYIIDQHGASERVAFERLKREYLSSKALGGQLLLIPERFEAGPEEAVAIKEAGDVLKRLGFEIVPFGPGILGGETFLIKAVPEILGSRSSSMLLKDLAEEMADNGGSAVIEDEIESVLMRIACHSVIRGARPLKPDEARALFRSLACTDFAGHCPHGRPVVKRIPRKEIEAFFKR